MKDNITYASLTRISDLTDRAIKITALERSDWANGQYVAVKVSNPGNGAQIEHQNGRMMDANIGQIVIGALGVRSATLELTGSWEYGSPHEELTFLTGAGVLGVVTSISPFCPEPIRAKYLGHVIINGNIMAMSDYVIPVADEELNIPIILLIGTSMASGKTTVGRNVVRVLNRNGFSVAGVKLSGAGRYRDILALKDAGAQFVLDFVDAGLPSTICSTIVYKKALNYLTSRIANLPIDIAVAEIGASPFEAYNGDLALKTIENHVKFKILCTGDPYAVLGITKLMDVEPDMVCGPVVNTQAGINLMRRLTSVSCLNLLEETNLEVLWKEIQKNLHININ